MRAVCASFALFKPFISRASIFYPKRFRLSISSLALNGSCRFYEITLKLIAEC